jgi:hypothetical protein
MRKIVFSTLIGLLLLFAMIVVVSAQTRTVGVKVGDWFKYGDVAAQWTSNDPNATVPSIYKSIKDAAWMEMTITAVSSTNVTAEQITHWKNGTETGLYGWVDIDTGDGENFNDFLVSANLNPGDTEYSSTGYSNLIINYTISENNFGTWRLVNHFNTTYSFNSNSSVYSGSAEFVWDRSTGVAIEVSQYLTYQTGSYTSTLSYHFRLTDSDVVPEFPSPTSVLLVLIVLTTVIVALSKRRILKSSRLARCQNDRKFII